jgi:hypothetical protein
VLNFDGIGEFDFTAPDDVPPFWLLYESADGGVTYTQVASAAYAVPIYYMPSHGGLDYVGYRSLDGATTDGPPSNIITS